MVYNYQHNNHRDILLNLTFSQLYEQKYLKFNRHVYQHIRLLSIEYRMNSSKCCWWFREWYCRICHSVCTVETKKNFYYTCIVIFDGIRIFSIWKSANQFLLEFQSMQLPKLGWNSVSALSAPISLSNYPNIS